MIKKEPMLNVLFFIERLTCGGQQTYMLNILKNTKCFTIYTAYFVNGPMKKDFDKISKKSYQMGTYSLNLKYYIKRPYYFVKILMELRKIIKEDKINIIITNGFMSYFFGCLSKLIVKVKVVRYIGCDLLRSERFHFVKRFNKFPLHKLTDLIFGYEDILKQHEKK